MLINAYINRSMENKTRADIQDEQERRRVPPVVQQLLAADVQLTKRVVAFSLNFVAFRSMRQHCKFLEVYIWIWEMIISKIGIYDYLCSHSTHAMD